MKTALSLQNENKVLGIFIAILSDVMHPLLLDEVALFGDDYDNYNTTSSSTSSKPRITIVDKHKRLIRHYLQAFTEEETSLMIQYAKEWNTLSQFSYLSQLLLDGFFVTQGVKPLLSVQVMKEGVEGYQAYTERHYTRVHRLSQSCHFLDYVTANITGIFPISLSASVLAARKNATSSTAVVEQDKEEGVTSQEEGGEEKDGEDEEELGSYWIEEKVGEKKEVLEEIPAVVSAEVVEEKGGKGRKRKAAVTVEEPVPEEGKRSSRRKK